MNRFGYTTLLRLSFAFATAIAPICIHAQSIERDAVTVPVTFQARFYSGDGEPDVGGFYIHLADSQDINGDAGYAGWFESERKTVQLKPGQDYIYSVTDRTDIDTL